MTEHQPVFDALMTCPRFRWKRGMINVAGDICNQVDDNGPREWIDLHGQRRFAVLVERERLDIDHPGNHGYMLSLVGEAWGPGYSVVFNPEGMVEIMHIPTANLALYVSKETGGLALATAMIAAPAKASES